MTENQIAVGILIIFASLAVVFWIIDLWARSQFERNVIERLKERGILK